MRPALIALLIVVMQACGHARPIADTRIASDVARQDAATVRVTTWCARPPGTANEDSILRGSGTGSGVIISRRRALTAAHVVECPGAVAVILITDYAGRRYHARTERIGVDGEGRAYRSLPVQVGVDLARVELEPGEMFEQAPPPELAPAPSVDDVICTSVAWPVPGVHHCGQVTATFADARWRDSGLAIPGNSGGPAFDDRGRIAGIVTDRYTRTGGRRCVELGPDWLR